MSKNITLTPPRRQRSSNLELLRIFAMLSIIAHHSVVNSGLTSTYDYLHPTAQQYFFEVWGMWGKTAINSFILISGYFLCKQTLTWKRYVKLLFEILFYSYIIQLIFWSTGYEAFTLVGVVKPIVSLFQSINSNFVASFMVFYAFVPLYNKLIGTLDQKMFQRFLLGILFVCTFTATFFHSSTMNEPFWYAVLYFIAAYFRLYPNKYTDSRKVAIAGLILFAVLSIASVVILIELGAKFGNSYWGLRRYYFVSDSNKLLALGVGVFSFLTAKNMKSFTNKIINFFSAGTFAVLLIHAASDTMRHWLWKDLLAMPSLIHKELLYVIAYSIPIPIVIYILCSLIDVLRRRYVEKPFMQWIDKY